MFKTNSNDGRHSNELATGGGGGGRHAEKHYGCPVTGIHSIDPEDRSDQLSTTRTRPMDLLSLRFI